MTRSPTHNPRSRRLIESGVALLIALSMVRMWGVDGFPGVCRVTGGSMATTLLGQHYHGECIDCGHRFVFGGEPPPPIDGRIWCPNCGYADNRIGRQALLAGDGLLINRSAFLVRKPRRWEPIAVRNPERADQLCVKRVAGLPGETVEIRHGDLYINGHIQRKSYAPQRAMAVLVHDASCPPGGRTDAPERWLAAGTDSRWGSHRGRFAHASGGKGCPTNWLVYHHWVRPADGSEPVESAPICDRCGYNQVRPRRVESSRAVADVMVEFRLNDFWGSGPMTVELSTGRRRFDARIWPSDGRFELRQDGRRAPTGEGRFENPLAGSKIVVSLFDRQLLLALDDRPVAAWPFDPNGDPSEPPATPIRIGAGDLGLVLDDVRVYRDVYFTRPTGIGARWAVDEPCRLNPEHFFLMGENSAVSEDSRTWSSGAGVAGKMIVGRPAVVWFPAKPVDLWGWQFQVPDPAQIRYIW